MLSNDQAEGEMVQGSHKLWKLWKTWKITKKKSSIHVNIMEFEKDLKNHGKIMEIL